MRVFITGPLGYVGKPVCDAFRMAGHQVSALVRTEEKAKQMLLLEVEPIIGDLSDISSYIHAIEQAEVIVHCAMDVSSKGKEIESQFVEAVLDQRFILNSRCKSFVYTSGVWILGNSGEYIVEESSLTYPLEIAKWRSAVEEKILNAARPSFRTVVLRPGCVYGAAGGLTSLWFSSTLRGHVEIVGDGQNHWAMIHQADLADAYVRVVEQELSDIVLNIVDHSFFTVKQMTQAVSDVAGISGKIHSLSYDAAEQKYGAMLEGLLIDQRVSNERAIRLLGWRPRHRNFIDGINRYYLAWKTAQSKLY